MVTGTPSKDHAKRLNCKFNTKLLYATIGPPHGNAISAPKTHLHKACQIGLAQLLLEKVTYARAMPKEPMQGTCRSYKWLILKAI